VLWLLFNRNPQDLFDVAFGAGGFLAPLGLAVGLNGQVRRAAFDRRAGFVKDVALVPVLAPVQDELLILSERFEHVF
jgi:hypothetical protein